MAKIKITKRSVEALKVTSKDYIAFDTDLPGFGVRVMPSGKRFFLVQYRRHGRTRRLMIGQFEIVTAELARREATIKLGSVRGADGDPAALRDANRQSTTMKELGSASLRNMSPFAANRQLRQNIGGRLNYSSTRFSPSSTFAP